MALFARSHRFNIKPPEGSIPFVDGISDVPTTITLQAIDVTRL